MSGSHDHPHSDHSHDHKNDDAERWKHDGIRVIPGNQLDPNVPSTAGMDRKAAINFARVGAQKLWAGTVTTPAGRQDRRASSRASREHHICREGQGTDALGRASPVHRGSRSRRFHFCAALRASPGNQCSPDEVLECVLVRSDGEAVAINLDIEPVEKPETVLWIDPVHRDPAEKKYGQRCLTLLSLEETPKESHVACSLREQWPRRHNHDGSRILA